MKLRALVPTGHGINCESETSRALELAGFDTVDQVHLNFIARGDVEFAAYGIIVFPGGFLDGDDLGAAQACANRIRHTRVKGTRLIDHLVEFVKQGGLVLGVCNGFQLLVKLGMLPAFEGDYARREVSLTANDSGRFEDRWVYLSVDRDSPCIFTRGIERLYLPVRHGEGKIIGSTSAVTARLLESHQAVLRYTAGPGGSPTMEYPWNPNGAEHAIAGVCDPSGRVFGMMPHPEAFQDRTNHPRWTREDVTADGLGLAVFSNAASFIRGS